MTEFIYKVAPQGEGKTRWLVEQAKNEIDSGELVVLLTNESNSGVQYKKFIENYFVHHHEVCKVNNLSHLSEIPTNSIVLIDDLFKLVEFRIGGFEVLNNCKRVYITLNGTTTPPDFNTKDDCQLSIFDIMREGDSI